MQMSQIVKDLLIDLYPGDYPATPRVATKSSGYVLSPAPNTIV
jgi:hypothetical protein